MLSAPRALVVLLLAAAAPAQNRADPSLASVPWRGERVLDGTLLIRFKEGTPPDVAAQRLTQLRTNVTGTLPSGLVRVLLPIGADLEAVRAMYAALPEVEFAQPDVLHRPVGVPNDPKWAQQWALPLVRADLAWDAFTGSPAAVVAVIDSGVDVAHPDLAGQLAWGHDPWAGDSDPTDTDGHGTHCSGVAAALTGNGLGVAGAAPGCRFAAYRCGTNSFPSSALVAAIDDAVARGALVLSMSWGSSYDDQAIHKALQAAAAQGCLLVAAAGNDNSTAPFYPAAHPFVIAVGASTSTDARAAFSNWGPWVDLAAPGQSIVSTWKGGQYKSLSGTSMACPLVAGAATLLYARLGPRSPAHAAQVRAALEDSAADIGAWIVHGRLDMAAAMELLFPPQPPELDVPATATAGALFSWSCSGSPGETAFLLVALQPGTLTWSGAQLLAAPALVLGLPLDVHGEAGLTLTLPAGAAGLVFHSQLATWNGALTGVTPVATTTIG
jgi:thermitase